MSDHGTSGTERSRVLGRRRQKGAAPNAEVAPDALSVTRSRACPPARVLHDWLNAGRGRQPTDEHAGDPGLRRSRLAARRQRQLRARRRRLRAAPGGRAPGQPRLGGHPGPALGRRRARGRRSRSRTRWTHPTRSPGRCSRRSAPPYQLGSQQVTVALPPRPGHRQRLPTATSASSSATPTRRWCRPATAVRASTSSTTRPSAVATHTRIDEARLYSALENHEFLLHWQPIVRADTHELIGAEALLRWQAPGATNTGVMFPHDFLPLLEKSGLIVPVGEWVIDETCRQAVAWSATHPARPRCSSPATWAPTSWPCPGSTRRCCASWLPSGMPPDRLVPRHHRGGHPLQRLVDVDRAAPAQGRGRQARARQLRHRHGVAGRDARHAPRPRAHRPALRAGAGHEPRGPGDHPPRHQPGPRPGHDRHRRGHRDRGGGRRCCSAWASTWPRASCSDAPNAADHIDACCSIRPTPPRPYGTGRHRLPPAGRSVARPGPAAPRPAVALPRLRPRPACRRPRRLRRD